MIRYRALKTQSSDEEYEAHVDHHWVQAPNLFVDEQKYTYTGLLDRHGNEYVRVPDQIGFVRFKT